RLGIKEVGPALHTMVADRQLPASVRVETLKALEILNDPRLPQAIKLAVEDSDARLRTAGRRALARLRPAEAPAALEAVLEQGPVAEQQGALAILGEIPGAAAEAVLGRWLDKVLAGQVPLEIQLDLLDAAGKHSAPALQAKLTRLEAARSGAGLIARFRETLAGGNAEAGRRIFLHKE